MAGSRGTSSGTAKPARRGLSKRDLLGPGWESRLEEARARRVTALAAKAAANRDQTAKPWEGSEIGDLPPLLDEEKATPIASHRASAAKRIPDLLDETSADFSKIAATARHQRLKLETPKQKAKPAAPVKVEIPEAIVEADGPEALAVAMRPVPVADSGRQAWIVPVVAILILAPVAGYFLLRDGLPADGGLSQAEFALQPGVTEAEPAEVVASLEPAHADQSGGTADPAPSGPAPGDAVPVTVTAGPELQTAGIETVIANSPEPALSDRAPDVLSQEPLLLGIAESTGLDTGVPAPEIALSDPLQGGSVVSLMARQTVPGDAPSAADRLGRGPVSYDVASLSAPDVFAPLDAAGPPPAVPPSGAPVSAVDPSPLALQSLNAGVAPVAQPALINPVSIAVLPPDLRLAALEIEDASIIPNLFGAPVTRTALPVLSRPGATSVALSFADIPVATAVRPTWLGEVLTLPERPLEGGNVVLRFAAVEPSGEPGQRPLQPQFFENTDATPFVSLEVPPSSLPLSAEARIQVFLHAPAALSAEVVTENMRQITQAAGIDVTMPPPANITISSSNVRYFYVEDREVAEIVAASVSARLRDFTGFDPLPPAGTIEVWLAGEGGGGAKVAAPKPVKKAAPTRRATKTPPPPKIQPKIITRKRATGLGRLLSPGG